MFERIKQFFLKLFEKDKPRTHLETTLLCVEHMEEPAKVSILDIKDSMQKLSANCGEPANTLIVGTRSYNSLLLSHEFMDYFDPTSNVEALKSGYAGEILGLSVVTDAFYDRGTKILDIDYIRVAFIVG